MYARQFQSVSARLSKYLLRSKAAVKSEDDAMSSEDKGRKAGVKLITTITAKLKRRRYTLIQERR